jgi:predicted DNA-binding protein (UPF0251 family)
VVTFEADDILHYGTPRHSGRYPYGSGGENDGAQPRNPSFYDRVREMRKQGIADVDICRAEGIGTTDKDGNFKPSTTQLRARFTIERAERQHELITTALRLKEKGMSQTAAAERMGIPESTYRTLIAPGAKQKAEALTSTADMLKEQVDKKKFVMIGVGVEHDLGISQQRLDAAVSVLREKGYVVETIPVPQVGTGKNTKTKVLAAPGTTWGDIKRNQDNIQSITDYSTDGGLTFNKIMEPKSISPKRVSVVYKEQGGDKADGVIYVRPGVKDLDIGDNHYAQVRIKVGEGHFLKGMAVIKDDLPDGVDLEFHTNKSDTGNKLDAMKKLKDDPDLPFGSVVRQIVDRPGHPEAKVTSVMNMVGTKEGSGAEGSWDNWSRNLSSQVLSKQPPRLAKDQLDLTYQKRKQNFDEINALTNPTVKKVLLEDFASSTDSAAVHLKAAHMPRQATRVILPMNSLKPGEVYAPGFRDGETVALIRFPHGGTFEIPEVTVNNRHRAARKILGDSKDAIGIHHTVAQRLSGADFDGDTVLVIPNTHGKIVSTRPLDGLKDFDPKIYKIPEGSPIKVMDARTKGREMGDISNLITDMTIRQASREQLARAVKHSMVVIDAEKHELNWKQSAKDHGIAALKQEYQGSPRGGASTLISRKKRDVRIPERREARVGEGGAVDPTTGARRFVPTGRTTINKDGERVPVMQRVKALDLTDDAHTFSSHTPMEKIYADHSNRLKSLANQARLSALNTPPLKHQPSATKVYKKQVDSLTEKLRRAERNAPRERQAQILANSKIKAKRAARPDIEKEELTKLRYQELEKARVALGARKIKIDITQDEWDAIQAGAITNSRLLRILRHTDADLVRELATPRTAPMMTPALTDRARQMLGSGATRAEVADALGVSLTTLDTATNS